MPWEETWCTRRVKARRKDDAGLGDGGFCLEKRECKSGVWLAVRGGKIPCLEEESIPPAGFV